VKLKAKDEESITSAICQISDRIPDFKVYERIYPDPSLGLMLAVAYKDVILLAREATSYFQTSGLGQSLTYALSSEEQPSRRRPTQYV
jgi:hypothetical protein